MKKQLLLMMLIVSVFSCSKEAKVDSNSTPEDIISFEDLKVDVENTLMSGEIYNWNKKSDLHIFSAGQHADAFYSIGYTISPEFDMINKIHEINLKDNHWLKARKEIYDILLSTEIPMQKDADKIEDIQPYGEVENFPQVIVKIENLGTIKELMKSPYVRYVEPLGFSIEDLSISERSGSGCNSTPNYSINSADYNTISPSVKRPWNYDVHNIDDAWNNSNKGAGLRVCIIDTGASDSQDNLGSQFSVGQSTGRNVQKYSTHYTGSWWWKTLDSPNDQCGHGTSMAGFATAPRGSDGNAVGVAYKANLMTIRAVEDVLISSSNERNGVRDALYLAGGRSDVKIISMSIGSPFYSSTVADGIYYAYNNGKMIVSAAGTSLTWTTWYGVIFPATMSQTVAVTGLKQTSGYQRCATCHDGSAVDFALIMERNNGDNDRTSLSLANYSNQPKYTGGSSCATATFAGIAALRWSNSTSASRTTILNSLKNSSEFYPNRHSDFGYGKIDANAVMNN